MVDSSPALRRVVGRTMKLYNFHWHTIFCKGTFLLNGHPVEVLSMAWPWLDWPQVLLQIFWDIFGIRSIQRNKLVGLEQELGNGAAGGSNPKSLWKKIPINCSLGRLEATAITCATAALVLLEEKEARVAGYRVNSQYVSPVQHFLALLISRLFLRSNSSVFDWKRCTPNWHYWREEKNGRREMERSKDQNKEKKEGTEECTRKERRRKGEVAKEWEKKMKKKDAKKTSCQINKQWPQNYR